MSFIVQGWWMIWWVENNFLLFCCFGFSEPYGHSNFLIFFSCPGQDFWATFERLLRDFWDTFERLLRDFWETFERQRQRQKSDLDSIRNSCDVFQYTYGHKSLTLNHFHLIPCSTKLYWPTTTKYQPLLSHINPAPTNTNQHGLLMTHWY